MIVRRNLKLSIIAKNTWKQVLAFTVLAVLVTWAYETHRATWLAIPFSVVPTLGTALAIFLAFRNNSSYDRWWEARKLWGALVNASRSFARQVLTLPDGGRVDAGWARELVLRQAAFAHALRLHLRQQAAQTTEYAHLVSEGERVRLAPPAHAPTLLLLKQGERLAEAAKAGALDSFRWMQLDQTLSQFTDILGACERIKNTPLPRQYDYFPRLFRWLFAGLLPLALVRELSWGTVLVTVPISFVFLALESVGRLNEDPFENRFTDTPLTALSRTIERSLKEHLGDSQLPEPLKPVDGFLM